MFACLVALLAVAVAREAGAETLAFEGTLSLHISNWGSLEIPGTGTATVNLAGANHLESLTIPAGAFGPINATIEPNFWLSANSMRFTIQGNETGSFTGLSGAPPGGGAMGVTGTAKLCLIFAPCQYAAVPFPLTPTPGGAGFGIGGTALAPGAVAVTLQHAPWTVGQPTMTIHTANTNITTPVLPGGFAHGRASATSSTASGGVLQMVTATKVYTSLQGAFPEVPVTGVLNIEFVRDACDDLFDNDGDGFADFPDDPGCNDLNDDSEQSAALVCDNGLDDDGDGLSDSQDPGCDQPTDPSEQSSLIACDDGADNDGDGLVDTADPGCSDPGDLAETDPALVCDDGLDNDGDGLVDAEDAGCDDPLDAFEQNCGHVIQFTNNLTEDSMPAVSQSQIVWRQWDGSDFEVQRWDGSSSSPLTNDAALDTAPSIAGPDVAWQEWGGGDSRILVWQGSTPVPLTGAGVSGWDPDVDDSGVVWSQGASLFLPPEWVYYWDGSTTTQVFGSAGGEAPALEDGTIVWETAAGIHMWTGSATVLIPGSAGGHEPAIWKSNVVWHASDGSDDEIFRWNGSITQQLTDNASDDRNADISANRMVWESDQGIHVWKAGETSLIAGSLGGAFPRIDGLDVVWRASDGSDNEIFLVTVCAACNDGADNDGDGKIDYDGGLSALGYVAAEPDGQCTDKPWRDKENRGGGCGLGFELALILPTLVWLRRRRQSASEPTSSAAL